jgi:excisionase family DNA binding protein
VTIWIKIRRINGFDCPPQSMLPHADARRNAGESTGFIPANSGEDTMHNPLVHSIAAACEAADTGRTALYEAINSGGLRAVKRGRRTLILDDDLRRWVQTLPQVAVKPSQRYLKFSASSPLN